LHRAGATLLRTGGAPQRNIAAFPSDICQFDRPVFLTPRRVQRFMAHKGVDFSQITSALRSRRCATLVVLGLDDWLFHNGMRVDLKM
jgi:hypothetical protein